MKCLNFLFGDSFKKDSGYSWFTLCLSFTIISFNSGLFFSAGNVFVALQQTYATNREETAEIINTLTIPFYIAGLLAGPLLKWIGYRRTATLAIILNVAGVVLSSRIVLDNRRLWFMICFPLIGSGLAILHPACFQITFSHFHKLKGIVSSIIMLSNSGAAVVFSLIFENVYGNYGLSYALAVYGTVSLQCIVLVSLFREFPKPKSTTPERVSLLDEKELQRPFVEDLTVYFKNYRVYGMIISMCFGFVAFTTLISTIIDLATDNGSPIAVLMIVIHSSGETLSRIPIGLALDKKLVTSEMLIAISMTLSAVFYVCIPLSVGYVLAILCFANGFVYGCSSTGRTCLIAEIGQEFIAISFGVSGFAAGLLNIVVPSLIGWSRDVHGTYNYVYYVFSVLQLFSAIVLYVQHCCNKKYIDKVDEIEHESISEN